MQQALRNLRNCLLPFYLLVGAVCIFPAAVAAQLVNPTVSDANGNTAAGTDALPNVTADGFANTAVGRGALKSTTGGLENTAVGDAALETNTGNSNTAVGVAALFANTTGFRNAAFGSESLLANTTGDFNTAAGSQALGSNTTGENNVALGYLALFENQTGRNNTAIGTGALVKLAGNNNIALGTNAGKNTTAGNHNIYIGHPGINGSERRITRIGRVQEQVFIAGIAGVPLSGAHVVVRANGQLGMVASSVRYKQDVQPLNDTAANEMAGKLAQLRPVSYRYKAEPGAMHYGLIAEEVATVMPELVVRDEDSQAESVQYMELIPLLLQQWKAQQTEIARQRARLERQETELAAMRQTLAERNGASD